MFLAGLTLLARGLFVLDRGFWQDDANVYYLAHAIRVRYGYLAALVRSMWTPTRVLTGVPSLVADLVGFPVAARYVMHGLTGLAIAVAAAALVKILFPGRRLAAFSAGALTVCASSDFLTTSLVAAENDLAVLGFLVFLLGSLRFLRGDHWSLLAAGIAGLLASVYTMDVATPALVLVPVLFAVAPATPRRRVAAFAVSGIAIAPYAFAFARFLRDPTGYASVAILRLEPSERAIRAVVLLLNNVLPWQWAMDRPEFGAPPPRVIPVAVWALVAVACVGLYAIRGRRLAAADPPVAPAGPRAWALLAVLLAMGAASNIAFASVHFSDIFYRTHLVSRVFASVGLGVAVDALVRSRRPVLGWALAATFIGFGAAGAMERQDYFLSSWREQRIELVSLLETVPSVRPGTSLVLYMPEDPSWHATKVDYLTRAWVRILYDDMPALSEHAHLWTLNGLSTCRVEDAGVRCWADSEHACYVAGTCPGRSIRYEDLVVVAFRPLEGRYRLVLRGDSVDAGITISSPLYAPERLIGPPRPFPERLLPGPLLARLLPAFRD